MPSANTALVTSCLRAKITCSAVIDSAVFPLTVSLLMGFGPQNEVSKIILCGDGDRDTPEMADNRLTADPWLPTLEMRLVRPEMHSSAATSELAESFR